ncbi:restriction endonuclease subunit S [Acinetobacter baumannii]|uniref:restriction endonuclease subunit S n=1 Tax=Acinetobacter baumannii TaxID=470 RepID=UPI0022EB5A5D|nr:restriction endonuclease subunit S [Acinetobacter baumannii]MDA3499522.1 restriction endonuclease subunit S [Acinetobacter baumannii]
MSIDFPKNWKQVVLEDALDALIDYRGKTPKKVDKGIPLITAKVVKSGRILPMDEFIADEDYESWMVRGIPQISDIVVTTEAPLGEVAQIKNANVALAQRIVTLRGKVDFLENDFLLFLMQSDFVQNQLEARATGSTVKGIKQSELRKIILPIPPIAEQKCIGKILSDLDDKIHLNNQINQTLESIAQAIFKSWFIDFEPVRAKILAKQEGKDPELAAMCAISGKSEVELEQMAEDDFAELQATAALFPDELVESELGEVPRGWGIGCVGDIAMAKGGYAFKSSQFVEKGCPVIKIKNIVGNGEVDIQDTQCIEEKTARTSTKFILKDGDLVMAMTGATVGKIGLVNTYGKSIYLNQRVAKFESDVFGNKVSYYLFCLFNRQEYFEQVVGAAQGSAQPNISSSGIESTKIVVPDFELINQFFIKVDSIFQFWLKNGLENNALREIRDTLLPKLLSGEIDVFNVKESLA